MEIMKDKIVTITPAIFRLMRYLRRRKLLRFRTCNNIKLMMIIATPATLMSSSM